MSSIDDGDEPLDPAVERVRRKMVRLLMVSISIMMVGLMAVLGAIVYKVANDDTAGLDEAAHAASAGFLADSRLDLPAGAEILTASLDGSRILLHLREGADQSLVIFDLADGKIVARVALE